LNQEDFLGKRRCQRRVFNDGGQVKDQVFGFIGAVQDEHEGFNLS